MKSYLIHLNSFNLSLRRSLFLNESFILFLVAIIFSCIIDEIGDIHTLYNESYSFYFVFSFFLLLSTVLSCRWKVSHHYTTMRKDLSSPCFIYMIGQYPVNIPFKRGSSCLGSLHNEIETTLKGSLLFSLRFKFL